MIRELFDQMVLVLLVPDAAEPGFRLQRCPENGIVDIIAKAGIANGRCRKIFQAFRNGTEIREFVYLAWLPVL